MARRGGGGGGGLLFEGGDYFKYFRQSGAINRGTAIIRGNTVLKLNKLCHKCTCFASPYVISALRNMKGTGIPGIITMNLIPS